MDIYHLTQFVNTYLINHYNSLSGDLREHMYGSKIEKYTEFIEKDRIPEFVALGIVDVGICGEYLARQAGTSDDCIIKRLGFNKSTLSLAIPRDAKYKGIEWFMGKTIATPYPDLLLKYLKSHGIKAKARLMREHVYMAPKVGIADAICDRVYSGTALMSENLKEVETVMTSEAILIATPNMTPLNKMSLN